MRVFSFVFGVGLRVREPVLAVLPLLCADFSCLYSHAQRGQGPILSLLFSVFCPDSRFVDLLGKVLIIPSYSKDNNYLLKLSIIN
jgi:hypothetical protein